MITTITRTDFELWARVTQGFDLTPLNDAGDYADPRTAIAYVGWSAAIAKSAAVEAHCVTCQCNRISAPAPMPDNRNSRSWHATAADKS
jgi:hypothetical protein